MSDRPLIPQEFLQGKQVELNTFIQMLETEINTQNSLNQIYENFTVIVTTEMKDQLYHREIHTLDGGSNKKRVLHFFFPLWFSLYHFALCFSLFFLLILNLYLLIISQLSFTNKLLLLEEDY